MDNQRPSPPSWSTRFLAWFLKEDYYEDIQGDLEEEFQIIAKGQTLVSAKKWYVWQIMKLFKPNMMKKIEAQNSIEKETSMFKNYFKIGLRNLWKYKAGTIINIIGLSTGIAAFMLIALFIKDEIGYDSHHEHAEEVYRVTVKNHDTDGAVSRQWAFASAGHAERLKADYSDISHTVRFYPWTFPDITVEDKKFSSEQVIFTSNDVFETFSFPFIAGNKETAFDDPYSLVLTETSAIRLFGNDWLEKGIIGEQVKLARSGTEVSFKITGVMENMPARQHFHFEYLAPSRFLQQIMDESTLNNVGGDYNWLTYIRLQKGTKTAELQNSVNNEFWDKYVHGQQNGMEPRDYYAFEFQPLLDIHLHSNLEGEIETNGSYERVVVFSTIGILLLLVAIVNYMNIATSHYSRRMKEVGVRKVIGAFKSTLIKQFLTESTLITIISLPIAVILIIIFLPYLNAYMGKELVFNPISHLSILALLVSLVLGTGIIAGIYPAVFLSKISLVQALKGEQVINARKWNFRSWLVTFQYAVTIALIFTIVVIKNQMQFIQNADSGYSREQVLELRLTKKLRGNQAFKNQLLEHPNIINASFSKRIPTSRLADNWDSRIFKGDSAVATTFRLPIVSVDNDFLKTYKIDLVAGEDFSERHKTVFESHSDTLAIGHYIVNEAAARAYGFSDPASILGQKMQYGPSEGRIIGVMKDFHFESMHTEIGPMLLLFFDNYRRISLKMKEENIGETLEYIESTFATFDSENTPNYNFVDELFNDQYNEEEKLSDMIQVFAAIAILIGALGLIGMVGFIIETKIKEIGVRKVLGATATNIWMIIGYRFLILIGIGFLVALPISYYLMDSWLDNFVYRVNISFFTIAIPAFLTLAITILVISYQTIKATHVNPVECLKDE